MRTTIKAFFFGVAISCIAFSARAENLAQIYEQALVCDPTFQSAKAGYLAAAELLPQSLSNLLPHANAYANTSANHVNLSLNNKDFAFFIPPADRNFNSKGYSLVLSQPLFDFGSWALFKQAGATVKQSYAVYAAACQDLIMRVSQAYFNVLFAQDNLRYIRAKKETTQRQLTQIRSRYKVGLDARTALEEAKAGYDRAVADEIRAQNDLLNRFETLKQITGICYEAIAGLRSEIPLMIPTPNCACQWICSAKHKNLRLQAARFAMQAAKEKVKANYAGHFPVLNAVGVHEQQSGAFFDIFNYRSDSAALQLSVPIYSGGSINSQVRQARFEYQQACADMQANYRDAVSMTQQQFNNVMSGVSRIKADKQAIISAGSALHANQAALKAGTRTIVDVLIAQQNLLSAQQAYSSDQYAYLLDTLRLKQYAGTLNACDLCQINRWLTCSKAVFPPDMAPQRALLEEESYPLEEMGGSKGKKQDLLSATEE
jgi:outer membrane protein